MPDTEVPVPSRPASPYLRGQPRRGGLARRTLALGLGLVLLLLLLYPLVGDNGLSAFLRLRSQREDLRQEVERLERERQQLATEIDALRRGHDALERVAREDYNLRRPDEQVLRLVPGTAPDPPSP